MRIRAILAVLVWIAGCADQDGPVATDRFLAGDRAAIPVAQRQPGPARRPVELAPAGVWQVRDAPRRYVAYQGIEAEIALALGHGDGLVAIFDRPHLARLQERYYSQLPGVGFDLAPVMDLPFAEQVDLELFLGLEADALLIDPRLPVAFWGWSPTDLGLVARRVAPVVGNFIRYPRDQSWGPDYPQYDIDGYAARLARLFDAQERWQGLAAFREATIARIQAALPPVDQRPRICVLNIGSDPAQGRFHLVESHGGGARTRHFRDLGLVQAWDATQVQTGSYGACDYETLAAIDPPVLIVQWAVSKCDGPEEFHRRFVQPLQEHPLGRRLQAVRAGLVLPGGTGEQGPLTHLFQLEMLAQQLFPTRFGSWTWSGPPDEPLFDRAALAAIITGER
ncbi:MAG: ABC transporter substrate-binding protein [Planctomycetota bacterium]